MSMQQLDDSSSDDEYVPTAKELRQAEETGPKVKSGLSSEDELTGIALLKAKKRQREVDDLFDLMNEEDDYTKKRQKVAET
jgi:hypothetical protein